MGPKLPKVGNQYIYFECLKNVGNQFTYRVEHPTLYVNWFPNMSMERQIHPKCAELQAAVFAPPKA